MKRVEYQGFALNKQKIATLKSKPTEKHLVGCQWNKSPNALTLAKKVLMLP